MRLIVLITLIIRSTLFCYVTSCGFDRKNASHVQKYLNQSRLFDVITF